MEAPTAAAPVLQSHQSTNLPPVCLAQLQSRRPSLVSTGIGVSVEERRREQNQQSFDTFLSGDLAVCVNQQKDEIERFLHAQVAFSPLSQSHCFCFSIRPEKI